MSRFVTPLNVRKKDDSDTWILISAFLYKSDVLGYTVVVHAGFETDFASVPRLPLMYWLFGDTAHEAAVVHDFLYRHSKVSRSTADAVLREASEAAKVPAWRRWGMWAGARLGGWASYGG